MICMRWSVCDESTTTLRVFIHHSNVAASSSGILHQQCLMMMRPQTVVGLWWYKPCNSFLKNWYAETTLSWYIHKPGHVCQYLSFSLSCHRHSSCCTHSVNLHNAPQDSCENGTCLFCEEVCLRRIYSRMVLRLNGRVIGTSLWTSVLRCLEKSEDTKDTAIQSTVAQNTGRT